MRIAIGAVFFGTAVLGLSASAMGRYATGGSRRAPSPASQAFFKPAEVASVDNAVYPPNAGSAAEGVVVLDVSLTEKGQAAEVGAVRDIPPLTAAAATAVQSWKFKPASQGDTPTPSAITVAFVYRPPVVVWQPPSFSPATPNPASSTNATTPAGILGVAYADYPWNSAATGAVIVGLSLDITGKITETKLLRGIAGLNAFALSAVKEWKFDPARFEGEAVKANVVIAFVFAQPVLNP